MSHSFDEQTLDRKFKQGLHLDDEFNNLWMDLQNKKEECKRASEYLEHYVSQSYKAFIERELLSQAIDIFRNEKVLAPPIDLSAKLAEITPDKWIETIANFANFTQIHYQETCKFTPWGFNVVTWEKYKHVLDPHREVLNLIKPLLLCKADMVAILLKTMIKSTDILSCLDGEDPFMDWEKIKVTPLAHIYTEENIKNWNGCIRKIQPYLKKGVKKDTMEQALLEIHPWAELMQELGDKLDNCSINGLID